MRAGIDEAGRGPMLGPLVVAGVSIEDEDLLRDLGVRDSKKLTPLRREKLAREIRQVCHGVSCVVLSAAEIDDGRDRITLNEIEAKAFAAVARSLPADEYVLDAADTSAERFGREFLRLLGRTPSPRVLSQHKADAVHPIVAAASIIAKVERDAQVVIIEQRLRRTLNMPLGSGYPSDPVTVGFLQAYVEQEGELPPDARSSWKPNRTMMAAHKVRPLSEF